MTLGERLFNMRKKSGLSQEQVAENLGVTRQTVSKWETDQTTPDFDKIIPISKLYNVSVNELFGEDAVQGDDEKIKATEFEHDDMSDKEMFEIRHKYKKRFAILLSLAVAVYILSVVPLILLKSEISAIVIFFIMIAAATAMIIFGAVSKPKFGKQDKGDDKENKLFKKICSIMSSVILVIYLLVSFLTGAWYITWVLWIVYAIACEIVKLIFLMRGIEINE